MPDYRLPADYGWRQDDDRHTLLLGNCPLVVIEPQGAGWLVRTALHAREIAAQRLLVRRIDVGKRWAARWVKDRQRLIAKACNRPDLLAPPSDADHARPKDQQEETGAPGSEANFQR